MARWDLNGGGGGDATIGCGGAWRGGAPGRCVAPTGRRVVCGQRLSTLRRVDVTDLSKAKTKADGDGAALFAAPNPRFTARTLRRGVNSRRRERFVAKNFIGRALCLRGPMRSCTRRKFRHSVRHARPLLLILLLVEFAQARSRVRANRVAVRRQVPLDQPSSQEGIAVLVHPRVQQLHDFLSDIGRQIQSRHLERLQRGFGRSQKKIPIHFLLGMLSQGTDLIMNAVRYPFNNTRQGKSLVKWLWKYVENPRSTERCESYRTRETIVAECGVITR